MPSGWTPTHSGLTFPVFSATVPMWFRLVVGTDKAGKNDRRVGGRRSTGNRLGMRNLQSQPLYNPGGYHFGGLAPVYRMGFGRREYEYHRFGPPTPIFARMPCWRSMAPWAMSPKYSPVTITSRLLRVRRIRFGQQRWWSARFFAACLALKLMPSTTTFRLPRTSPHTGPSSGCRTCTSARSFSTLHTVKLRMESP